MGSHDYATLYVDGEVIADEPSFCAETQCTLLMAAYIGQPIINIVVVQEKPFEDPKRGVKIPYESFYKVCHLQRKEIPTSIQACQLPAVLTTDQINVYSGLCTVLRYLVKKASSFPDSTQSEGLLSLLGHRMYCLKSCSEVSPRTKMCELHMPSIINKPPSLIHAEIPEAISLFETLLNEPVVIHNMDKRQRVLLKRLEGNSDSTPAETNTRKRKKVVWTKELPQLEHAFAEGVDFTLTDLCVFSCVDCFIKRNIESMPVLLEKIPKILKWYNRLALISKLKAAIQLCGMNFVELKEKKLQKSSNECISGQTEILELSQNGIQHKNGKKKETDMTLRRDLAGVLMKLKEKDIQTQFMEFKRNQIELDWSSLPKEIHPVEGELGTLRALRKCQQIENLAQAVKEIAKAGDIIVDFCSGGGHVGIALAYFLSSCHVVLVENKEESLERARARIYALNLKNVTIYQCNLEYFRGSFQIGVALHACGVATDMVVQSCISRSASFVISPCCYGKVRNCHWISYPQSVLYRNVPISFDESVLLGHAADKTSWNFENKHAVEGKKCMGLVDLDRAFAAREHGYCVSLYTMQPPTCTPKNNMLVGVAPQRE